MELPKTVTREKLYEEVWKTPGRQLGERYGVSDVALAKICRKMNVPRPYRGYWRRVESGQRPKRTRLPRVKPDTVLVHEFSRRDSGTTGPRGGEPKRKAVFRKPIAVPERLTNPHPLIKRSREALERIRDFCSWDRVYFSRHFLSVIVHPKAAGRAYRIMDSFLKAVEARGYTVGISESFYGGGCANIFGQEIRFDLRDRNFPLAGDDAPGSVPFAWSWEDGPAKLRLGLVFRVYRSWNNGCGALHWRDGKRKRLEDSLDEILLIMLHLARRDRHYQIRNQKREQERKEQERLRRLREAEIAAEQKRREHLMLAAKAWKQSALLREFIDVMGEKLDQNSSHSLEILSWAREVADEMDPFKDDLRGLLGHFLNGKSREDKTANQEDILI